MRGPSKTKRARRFVGGLAFLLLGSTAAVGLSMARGLETSPDASHSAPNVQPAPDRIPVSSVSVRQAYAAGLIDRPIKSILNVPAQMSYGEFRWNDKGVPSGPIWIRVDLGSQLLSVFRAGHEIGTAVILYGASDVPTPTGRFPILAKLKDHNSATYDDAPMPYTLRLTNDGVSIHASNVRWGYATHGCIGIPKDFAAKLFSAASIGDEVFITEGAPSGSSTQS